MPAIAPAALPFGDRTVSERPQLCGPASQPECLCREGDQGRTGRPILSRTAAPTGRSASFALLTRCRREYVSRVKCRLCAGYVAVTSSLPHARPWDDERDASLPGGWGGISANPRRLSPELLEEQELIGIGKLSEHFFEQSTVRFGGSECLRSIAVSQQSPDQPQCDA